MTSRQTERLWLRPWGHGDRDFAQRFYGDPEIMAIRKLGVLAPAAAAAELARVVAHWRDHGFGLWLLGALDGPDDPLGECGLRWLADGSDVELSYGLVPAARGRGLAAEAARAALDFGFATLGLRRVIAIANRRNVASHRVMARLGMTRLATEPGSRTVRYLATAPEAA